jgi:hypothetical protein
LIDKYLFCLAVSNKTGAAGFVATPVLAVILSKYYGRMVALLFDEPFVTSVKIKKLSVPSG